MTSFRPLLALTSLLVLALAATASGRANMALIGRGGNGGQAAANTITSCVADHRVGEIVLAVNNNGTFGNGFQQASSGDCFTGEQIRSCEYPKGSNTEYLFAGSFWIGAVVGRDTLVSVGADGWSFTRELTPDEFPMTRRSIIDPTKPEYAGAISEEDIISYYTDSITASVAADPFDGPHRPLYISVREASYAWSYSYAEDFVLFDYRITNVGNKTLHNVYMGLYNDGDVCYDCGNGGYSDDITGFLQTINRQYGNCTYIDTVNIAWLADNDGDLGLPNPVPNVTGMRVVRTPAETLEVSYNWWYSSGNSTLDFGPRERSGVGRLKEPFRDFGTGGLGTPETDRNKYYIMRNEEFDYDQAYVATILPTDTLWIYPSQEHVDEWAVGEDTRYLLSFGPFEILPGQSLPLSFAYVGGLKFHSVLGNLDHLPHDPDAFYANLNFRNLGENATWASWLYDNPGIDTDSNGYAGKYHICAEDSALVNPDFPDSGWTYLVADTIWYEGDGVPDFVGASPPPAPVFHLVPSLYSLTVRFNGTRSELARDQFTHERDFEGYRVYIARDNREDSYSIASSYDIEDYNQYVMRTDTVSSWALSGPPLSPDTLRCRYADSCNDPNFNPLNYTRSHPLVDPHNSNLIYYFEPQDFNASEFGAPGAIRKVYPDQPPPSSPLPDSADPSELTDEGLFKYYEYEYTIENLLPSVPYYVNVTAFDYGSPQSGLPSLETSVTIGAQDAYPSPSYAEVHEQNLGVIVYPNPYRIDARYRGTGFEGRGSDRPDDRVREIHFSNLPAKCTIRIYTLDGDLVRQIDHDKSEADANAAHDSWDMITRNTQMVVSGLYYWTVEAEGQPTQIGKLAIIM